MQMEHKKSFWIHPFFLLFLTIPSNSLICDSTDLASLISFSSGLKNPSPLISWTANSSHNCCNWTGIQCTRFSNSSQRITHLNLAKINLSGSISNSIGDLDHLMYLNLSQNSLEGFVPSGVFQLHNLKVLDLSLNHLSGPIAGNISLVSIQVFNISGNLFDGRIPILARSETLRLFDVSNNLFSGGIDAEICIESPRVQFLYFSSNLFSGEIPVGFGNCSSLIELFLDMNMISGNLPEDIFKLKSLSKLNLEENQLFGRLSDKFSNLSNLQQLDVSLNNFYGIIPNVFGNLSFLQSFCAESNRLSGEIPNSLSNLLGLGVLNLRNNSLSGEISLNFTGMPWLTSLDLGSNSLSGMIPPDLSNCLELQTLNLANNLLTGGIPESFKNLISLTYLSLSRNLLSNLKEGLGVLQHCRNLTNLVLTKNFNYGEEIPFEGIEGFHNIEVLAIPNCGLSGSIPSWLQNCTKLKVLDLSWNNLSGPIPPWLGEFNYLFYLDLSNNSLGGEIPIGLTEMKGLRSKANLQQSTSSNDVPFFIRKNNTGKGLQYNQVSSFPPSLILSNNKLVGSILKGFGNLKALHQLDLSKNRLSGAIPEEISGMSSLELLDLSHNNLTGNIPSALTKLTFLSRFIVAFNNLVGSVPSGGQFSTFSAADFEGNPGLCYFHSPACAQVESTKSLSPRGKKNKGLIIGMTFGIGLGTSLLLLIVYLIVSRNHSTQGEEIFKQVADSDHLEAAGSKLVILFKNKDKQELSIGDIMKATGNFDQSNIIGCGGFGLVYKAMLPDGSKVAIKRLSGDYGQMDREFQAEVETLSRAQHENLVLLQGYCKIKNDRLLIYTFMENGSLDYWLHEKLDGGSILDWNKRLQIARGAARGLEYLHQSCQPHILHRDIKSSNILLDGKFEAHLADFGLARLILPYNTHVTTDLVGTLGYIPPEYSQSSVATYKGDVYSFGVVLLELLTGKRPVDMTKPKSCKDLISWVFHMRNEGKETIVFDRLVYIKENEGQMLKILEIACICLSESPRNRPLTQQLVAWLNTIGRENNSL